MSMTIIFESKQKEDQVVNRLHQLVCPAALCGFKPFVGEGSESWTLDVGNDWRLGRLGEDRYRLTYRYVYDGLQWAALATVIEMFGIGKNIRVEFPFNLFSIGK